MVHAVIIPKGRTISLDIPQEYVGKEIDVIAFDKNEGKAEELSGKRTMSSFWGVMSDKTAETFHKQIEQNRREWDI